jgi:hypothetical protein
MNVRHAPLQPDRPKPHDSEKRQFVENGGYWPDIAWRVCIGRPGDYIPPVFR